MGTLTGVALTCALSIVREQGRGCPWAMLGAEVGTEPGREGSVFPAEAQLARIADRSLDTCGLSLLSL